MSDDAATGSRTPVTDGPAAGGAQAPERAVDGRGEGRAEQRRDDAPADGGATDGGSAGGPPGSRRVERGEPQAGPQSGRPQSTDPQATGAGSGRPQAVGPQAAGSSSGGPPDRPGQSGRQRPGASDTASSAPTTVLPAASGRPARPTARADRGGERQPGSRAGGERQGQARTGGERQPAARSGGRRRARLAVQRLDPWSVFLFSLVASICLGVVLFVAVAALYAALSSLGVLSSLNGLLGEVAGTGADAEVVDPFITPNLVLGATAVLAAINVVLLTALATLGALIYNLCASLTGGIEVQLGERE